MSYQDQLAIDFMAKLATSAALYQGAAKAEYTEFWLTAMDNVFDSAYKEFYGYLPHGC